MYTGTTSFRDFSAVWIFWHFLALQTKWIPRCCNSSTHLKKSSRVTLCRSTGSTQTPIVREFMLPDIVECVWNGFFFERRTPGGAISELRHMTCNDFLFITFGKFLGCIASFYPWLFKLLDFFLPEGSPFCSFLSPSSREIKIPWVFLLIL